MYPVKSSNSRERFWLVDAATVDGESGGSSKLGIKPLGTMNVWTWCSASYICWDISHITVVHILNPLCGRLSIPSSSLSVGLVLVSLRRPVAPRTKKSRVSTCHKAAQECSRQHFPQSQEVWQQLCCHTHANIDLRLLTRLRLKIAVYIEPPQSSSTSRPDVILHPGVLWPQHTADLPPLFACLKELSIAQHSTSHSCFWRSSLNCSQEEKTKKNQTTRARSNLRAMCSHRAAFEHDRKPLINTSLSCLERVWLTCSCVSLAHSGFLMNRAGGRLRCFRSHTHLDPVSL